jgi:hypothetical protein
VVDEEEEEKESRVCRSRARAAAVPRTVMLSSSRAVQSRAQANGWNDNGKERKRAITRQTTTGGREEETLTEALID